MSAENSLIGFSESQLFTTTAFENAVSMHPEKLAAISPHGMLTYAQLNTKANQLARHLQSIGVEQKMW
jgi:non-ribosomal peptide synthetase component F